MSLKIYQQNIATVETDAIVNSVATTYIPRGGVSGAIFEKAGEKYRTSINVWKFTISYGDYKITSGYDLPCKYILHTASPAYDLANAQYLLSKCYEQAIELAIEKEWTSIAFPLLSAGSNGFPYMTAIDIALNQIAVSLDSCGNKIEVHLVVFSDAEEKYAQEKASQLYSDYFDVPQSLRKMEEVEKTSFCMVSIDVGENIWLNRMVDLDENGFTVPDISNELPYIFANRNRIFHRDGPATENAIGVWKWTAIQNRNNPETDYVESWYQADIQPIRVAVISGITSEQQLAKELSKGIPGEYFACDTLFVYRAAQGICRGFLCKQAQFTSEEQNLKLSADVYSLPVFNITTDDYVSIRLPENNHFYLYKKLNLEKPSNYFTIGNTHDILRKLILERFTWSLFKDREYGTKADWRKCKAMLDTLSGSTLLDAVCDTLHCTPEKAQAMIEDFIRHADSLIEVGDFDTNVLAQVALHHEGLLSHCEPVVEDKWKKEHAEAIAAAEKEVDQTRGKVNEMLTTAQEQLQSIEQEKEAVEKEKNTALAETAAAQAKLDAIVAEIEQYEALGKETMEKVRSKIADAQKDMAGFIADLSVFLPQQPIISTAPTASTIPQKTWQYTAGTVLEVDEEVSDISHTWQEEVKYLETNLRNVFFSVNVNNDLCPLLAAYLYAVYINKVPLMITGPCGKDIADVISSTIYRKTSGCLELEDASCIEITNAITETSDAIIAVQNMFGKGWSDTLPQSLDGLDKYICWTHPYTEDMVMEPKGLYNYMLPLLSECFVEKLLPERCFPSIRADDFQAYISKKETSRHLRLIDKIGISKLSRNRLAKVLSDTKAILTELYGKSNDRDIELLFGLLPLAVLTGKQSLLKEVLESENNFSKVVIAEIKRYVEDE